MAPDHRTIVISVGGSLIVPDGIDTSFLRSFRDLILRHIAAGTRFVVITGGGKTARTYQQAGREIVDLSAEDLDWLGIHATRLNAHLVRAIFHEHAHPRIITDPTEPITATEPLVIAAGWKPGWSTDYDAVLIAKNLNAKKVVNLSNIEYAYTADPKKNPAAHPIERASWAEFRKLLPESWDPGLSSPFDPVAAKEAAAVGLEVAIMNGKTLSELEHYLRGEPFIGTVVR